MLTNPYRLLGIILSVAGAILAPIFYFLVGSVPLAATGLSAILIGVTCIVLANARPYISPEACQMLLKTGMENTAALVEELGIKSKAIYLPSNVRNGHPQALLPLLDKAHLQSIKEKLPGRLIIRYGPDAEDMAIAVTTPGSVNIDMLANQPGPTSGEIESAMTYIMTGVLDIASAVRVNLEDSRVNVEVTGVKIPYEDIAYYRCLGSPMASIAAAIASEALGKPIRVAEESYSKGKGKISLEVLS